MRALLRAVWPPLSLLVLTLVVSSVLLMLGWWPLALLGTIGVPIFILDARSRARDFRYAANHLGRGRSPERIAAIFRMSWCMRVACQTAAETVDDATAAAVRSWYDGEGYRWYHFTPDGTFTRQTPFLQMLFWRITLMGYDEGRRRTPAKPRVVVVNPLRRQISPKTPMTDEQARKAA